MKIRTDFVSNSSSSSFILYGVNLTDDEFVKAVIGHKAKLKKYEKYVKNDEGDYSFYELVEDVLGSSWNRKDQLTYVVDHENNEVYIGRHPDTMKDDETLGQFKKDTLDLINKHVNVSDTKGITRQDIKFISGVDCDGSIELN